MVLLINPKTTKSSQANDFYFREPNLGILYLAALLDKSQFDIEILDLEQYLYSDQFNLKNLLKKSIKYHRIFGITSLTNTYSKAIEIAEILKKINENFIIIMGGPHVSFFYEAILKNDSGNANLIDFICVGESENSFVSLVKILKRMNYSRKNLNKNEWMLNRINGIAYNDNINRFKFTGYEEKPINIENLPHPARNLLNHTNFYYNVANIIVNRGCPNQCSFCSRQNLFKKTRIRSVKSIFSEIRDIQSLHTYMYLNFYDNINITNSFFRKFCLKFAQYNENNSNLIPWGCELRTDTISQKDARLLRKSGCKLIATGIESANEVVLKQNFKFQNPKKVKEGILNLKKENLPIQAYFVLGLPGETRETFEETLNFIKKLPFNEDDKINYFIATPYPGSRLWTERENFGIKIFENDFDKYDCEHLIFETKDLSKEDLSDMIKQAKEIETYFS